MREVDLKSILDNRRARKMLSEIIDKFSGGVAFAKHAKERMRERNLSAVDVWNVLCAGNIYKKGEYNKDRNNWVYVVETNKIGVVFAFKSTTGIVIITAVRK